MSLVVSHETRRIAAAKPRGIGKPIPNPAAASAEPDIDPGRDQVLVELFGEALAHWCPRSAAAVRPPSPSAPAKRSAGLEVDFWYLDEPGNRYIRKCSLELRPEDLTGQRVDVERVKLVHLPLVGENLNAPQMLLDGVALAAPGGAISAVLELYRTTEFTGKVSRGQAPAIARCNVQHQWTPDWLDEALGEFGFRRTRESQRSLASGRKLWLGIFAK